MNRQNSPRQKSPKLQKKVPDKTVPLKALVRLIKEKVKFWSWKKALKSENQNHRGEVGSALGQHSEVAVSSPSGEKIFSQNSKIEGKSDRNVGKTGKSVKIRRTRSWVVVKEGKMKS